MSVIAINTQYVKLKPLTNATHLHQGFEGRFTIHSSIDALDIRRNDKVLVGEPINDDLRFISEATITKVSGITTVKPSSKVLEEKEKAGLPAPKDEYDHHFEFKVDSLLQKNNLLSDLEYSLKSVYIYSKPIRHFQHQYRAVIREDYDTIVNGWVYTARTIFGKIVNAIPRQNKLEFMLHAMDYFSTVDFSEVPLTEGLDFLNSYIKDRILSRGRLLVETNKLVKNNLSEIVPLNEIGFINPQTQKSNTLKPQAEIFEKIFDLETQINLVQFIRKSISENSELESRFIKIFKNQTWPIDLRV